MQSVLGPLLLLYDLDPDLGVQIADRTERTALKALDRGVPDGWLDQREADVLTMIEETMAAAMAIA